MSNATEQRKQVRRIVLRMVLDIHALARSRNMRFEEALIDFAIRIGQYEGHPVDTSTIASMTALPRTTVLRHINVMEAEGRTLSSRIGRRVVRYFPLGSGVEDDAFYGELERIVRRALDDLSEMDTSRGRHET